MKPSNDDHFESIIKQAIEKELENTDQPLQSTEEAWLELRDRLNKKQYRKQKRRFPRMAIYMACAIAFVISLIFIMPQGSEANKVFTEMFQKVQDNTVYILGGVGGENREDRESEEDHTTENFDEPDINDVKESEGIESVAEFVSLEEAQEKAAFPIRVPKVIPKGFELDEVMIMTTPIGKSDDVYLHYKGESEEAHFSINQKLITDEFGFGTIGYTDDVQVDKIEVNGYEAFLIQSEGYARLVWVTPNRYYSINGILSREEIIKMAHSL